MFFEEEDPGRTVGLKCVATFKNQMMYRLRELFTKAAVVYALLCFYLAYANPVINVPGPYPVRWVLWFGGIVLAIIVALVVQVLFTLDRIKKDDCMITFREDDILFYYLKSQKTDVRMYYFVTKATFYKGFVLLELLDWPTFRIIPRDEFVLDNREILIDLLEDHGVNVVVKDQKN